MCDLVEHFKDLVVFVHPRRFFRNHFVNRAAQAPNVSKSIVPRLLDNFRGHPVGRAAERLCLCVVSFNDLFGATEICQLTAAIVSNEDIRRLYISVNDIVVMKILETKQDLLSVACNQILRKFVILVVIL